MMKKYYKDIKKHAQEVYPKECCGVVINDQEYIPCNNLSSEPDQFYIDPKDIVAAGERGKITAYVHSHPDGTTEMSEVDKAQISLHGLPWIICAYPEGTIKTHKPIVYKAPLLGRKYFHGLQDCYSLVKDYYQRECGIQLSDYERSDLWWEVKANESLYLDNFTKEGFVELPAGTPPKKHDAFICRIGRTEHPNHAAVYLGDNAQLTSEKTPLVVGTNLILHHPYGRLSVREVYGENWQQRTVKHLRHKKYL